MTSHKYYDPYEIILNQRITKPYRKEIKADIKYYEEFNKEEQRHYEEKQKLLRRRMKDMENK